jgi:hypothetical protein
MSPYRILFRIAAALALILFFLMTYEPARCQTRTATQSSLQAAQRQSPALILKGNSKDRT